MNVNVIVVNIAFLNDFCCLRFVAVNSINVKNCSLSSS